MVSSSHFNPFNAEHASPNYFHGCQGCKIVVKDRALKPGGGAFGQQKLNYTTEKPQVHNHNYTVSKVVQQQSVI